MVSNTGDLANLPGADELAREIGAVERVREDEPQRANDAVHRRRRDARLLLQSARCPSTTRAATTSSLDGTGATGGRWPEKQRGSACSEWSQKPADRNRPFLHIICRSVPFARAQTRTLSRPVH
jgi:hypothetical protein